MTSFIYLTHDILSAHKQWPYFAQMRPEDGRTRLKMSKGTSRGPELLFEPNIKSLGKAIHELYI